MRRAATIATLVLGCWVAASSGPAFAQPRAGVPVAAVSVPGAVLLWVQAPDMRDGPARLAFAQAGARRAELVVDVWVTGGAGAAQRRAAALRDTMAQELAFIGVLGDGAWGNDRLVVLQRDNVVLLARVLHGSRSALVAASHLDTVLRTIPAGVPRAVAPSVTLATVPQTGAPVPIAFRGDVIAAHVSVDGDGYARRTRAGWVFTRTGDGPYTLRAVVVDSMLRVAVVGE